MSFSCEATELFHYGKQLSYNYVRVIEKTGQNDGTGQQVYRLRTISLDDPPRYIAISYTWGPPLDTKKCREEYVGAYRTILLRDGDGPIRRFDVGRNLWEAMQEIDKHFSPSPPLWADAICINQADTEERGMQVSQMARIFSRACRVIVWLGHGFEDEADALRLWTEVAPRVQKTVRIVGVNYFWRSICESSELELLFDGYDLVPLLETFRDFVWYHRWFHRVWIIQEVIMASRLDHSPMVLWSRHRLQWASMMTLCRLLNTVHPYIRVEARIRDAVGWCARTICNLNRVIESYQSLFRSRNGPGITANSYLGHFRPVTPKETIASYLAYLLSSSYEAKASEPRDKVYFAHGLMSELCLHFDQELFGLNAVHYRLPVEKVFQDTMVYLIREVPSLITLGFCYPTDNTSADSDIPHWVPKFNVPRYFFRGSMKQKAGLLTERMAFPRRIEGNRLTLTGVKLGYLKILSSLQVHKRLPKMKAVQTVLKFIGALSRYDKCLINGTEEVATTLLCGSYRNFDARSEIQPWSLGLIEKDESKETDPAVRYVERFVGFATSVLAESILGYDEYMSASLEAEGIRTECHRDAHEIAVACSQNSGREHTRHSVPGKPQTDVQAEIGVEFPAESEKPETDMWERLAGRLPWISEERTQRFTKPASEGGPTDDERARLNMDANSWFLCYSHLCALFTENGTGPSNLFVTESGFVGRCRKHGTVGDELWLIGDCPFPVILRPVEDGCYRFISPGWVHGVMEGELMTPPYLARMVPVTIV